MYKFRKNKYGKSLKNGFKQPLEKAPALKGKLFISNTYVIIIYVVIGGFSWKYLKWLD